MKLGFRSKIYIGLISLLLLLGIVIFFVVSMIMKEALLEENRNRGISISITLPHVWQNLFLPWIFSG